MSRKTASSKTVSRIVSAALLGALCAPQLGADDLNRIILRVNDEILTLYDYERRKTSEVTLILADPQLSVQDRQERISQIGPRIMGDMFRELLLKSRAAQLRIFISDQEVDEAVMEMVRSRGIQDEASLQEALASSGMTMEQLKEKTKAEMAWSQVVGQEVSSKVQVGEEELRAHYRSNKEEFSIPEKRWLKETIVLESSGKSPDELRQLALEIRDKLIAGGEFEAVIEPYRSTDLTTGVIDLDWLRSDELDSKLAQVAFELPPGAYSEPVASRGGLHILHLAGLEESKLLPFEEVQRQILNRERSRRFDQEMRNFLAELERTAYIREDLPPEAVGYRSLAVDYSPEEEIELFRQPELPPEESETDAESEAGASD